MPFITYAFHPGTSQRVATLILPPYSLLQGLVNAPSKPSLNLSRFISGMHVILITLEAHAASSLSLLKSNKAFFNRTN